MDLATLRLWALRVMGSLPLRCRCAFVVVKESICVFPCDATGRLDLRQTFVLRLVFYFACAAVFCVI